MGSQHSYFRHLNVHELWSPLGPHSSLFDWEAEEVKLNRQALGRDAVHTRRGEFIHLAFGERERKEIHQNGEHVGKNYYE